MDLKAIGKRIKEKRLEKSWSQEEFAEKVGLSTGYISMIERGEKIPKLDTFIRIANVLNVNSDELLTDVLEQGFIIRVTKYTEEIGNLSASDKKRIYGILDAFLHIND